MTNIVKFDLLGQRRLVFDDVGVTHHTSEIYPLPVPGFAAHVVTNRVIRYTDIRWIGTIRQRQWWALLIGAPALLLGLYWLATTWRDWGPFCVAATFSALLGVFPLWLFWRGRAFLAIVSATEMITLPADRKRRKIRETVEILKSRCNHENVEWRVTC